MSEDLHEASTCEMPQVLKKLGAQAISRLHRRQATPRMRVVTEDAGWSFSCPYRDEDAEEWEALLFEAFATRSLAVFGTFTNQLARLCRSEWNEESHAWHPNEDELIAAIQIIRSTGPSNEAEACLAAQMVAVHLMQLKLAAQALNTSWAEPRTCAIAGKLARTYAVQLETMRRLKGKGLRQRITVRKFSRHEHQHIHLNPGVIETGNQPYEPTAKSPDQNGAVVELAPGRALPCPNAPEDTLSVPGGPRAETVQVARGCKRDGRSARQ